ncbi:MAG: FecCD family ABC transporter permease [Omnitrophica WOR_2 bacterium]
MNSIRPYLLNIVFLLLALLVSVAVGAVFIPLGLLVRLLAAGISGTRVDAEGAQIFTTILFSIRLPHTALVAITGAALAGSGAAYQGLFRNPLADPYLIGVASGAGLGAVLAMALQTSTGSAWLYAVPLAAFAASLLTVAVVYLLARSSGFIPTTTLILAGVAVGSFATALTSFLMLRSQGELRRAIAWLLGGSTASGWQPVLIALPYVLLSLAALSLSGHMLNVLQFGDEQAHQLGLPVERAKGILIVSASLATAAAVSFSGIIGFVGLIIPHLARLLWGSDYRRLIPLSILGGATLLLLADLLARVVMAPEQLPVGIVTALAGAPFFLWVLRRSKK